MFAFAYGFGSAKPPTGDNLQCPIEGGRGPGVNGEMFVFPKRNSRCVKVNGRFCSAVPGTGTMVSLTDRRANLSVPTLYFRRGSGLGVARCARVYVLTIRTTVCRTVVSGNVAPSIATKLDLKRCNTLVTSKTVAVTSTFTIIEGEKVCVRGTIPANKTVATILKLSPRIVRSVYGGATSRAGSIMSMTGCGYPKRVIVAKRGTTMSTTTTTYDRTNTGEYMPLGIDKPFRSTVLGNTNRGLTSTLRDMRVRSVGIPCVAGIATSCIGSPTSIGSCLAGRISSSMH